MKEQDYLLLWQPKGIFSCQIDQHEKKMFCKNVLALNFLSLHIRCIQEMKKDGKQGFWCPQQKTRCFWCMKGWESEIPRREIKSFLHRDKIGKSLPGELISFANIAQKAFISFKAFSHLAPLAVHLKLCKPNWIALHLITEFLWRLFSTEESRLSHLSFLVLAAFSLPILHANASRKLFLYHALDQSEQRANSLSPLNSIFQGSLLARVLSCACILTGCGRNRLLPPLSRRLVRPTL